MKSTFNFIIGTLVLGLVLTTFSCRGDDMFDEEEYNNLMEREQTVDSVDQGHTWKLTTEYTVGINAQALNIGAKKVQIWDANAAEGESTTILAEQSIADGEQKFFVFSAPSIQTNFYAAIIDKDGKYTVDDFSTHNMEANFSTPLAKQVDINTKLVGYQTCTCCFEDAFPTAGDYDYNDLVLRFAYDRPTDNKLRLYVTLAAVGSDAQMAAAVRLLDYNYDDIESVTTEEDVIFDQNYPSEWRYMIDSSDLLVRGNHGEAVLRLFEDAHWSIAGDQRNNMGVLQRRHYNVSKTSSGNSYIVSPRTLSYVITFKDPSRIDQFTLGRIDPFAIVDYNSACYEVHASYEYRATEVLQHNTYTTKTNLLPWALMIPSGGFRYPLEGIRLGYFKNGDLFGAYLIENHSFGEWAANHTKALDWYNYPTVNMVY